MVNFYWLDRIQAEHRLLVGNKAFYLSRLLQKGYPVVPGFVIPAPLLLDFLESIDWSASLFADLPHSSLHLDIDNPEQLRVIAQQIRSEIAAQALPNDWTIALAAAIAQLQAPVVTLRASLAIASEQRLPLLRERNPVANGHSSALFNLQISRPTIADISGGLKRLWGELFSAKSLFYWQRLGIPLHQVRLAVLVQPVWPAMAAGTLHIDQTTLTVQAAPGLGMAIAWGEIVADLYKLDRQSGFIHTRKLGKKTLAYYVNDGADNGSASPATDGPDALQPSTSFHQEPHSAPPAGDAAATITVPVPLSAVFPPTRDFPIQPRLLPERLQTDYALAENRLAELIQLGQRLATDLIVPFGVEWLLYGPVGVVPQLYLTQVLPGLRLQADPVANVAAPAASVPAAANQVVEHVSGQVLVTGLGTSKGNAIAHVTVVPQGITAPDDIPPGTVLVAKTVPPHWLRLIKQAAAIVTEDGGMTSHSAIVAREMGIPAVMAAPNVTHLMHTGDLVMVDGVQGKVYRVSDTRAATPAVTPAVPDAALLPAWLQTPLPVPLSTGTSADGAGRIQLMVNLSQVESLPRLANLPIDGIGLLRSELLAMDLLEQQHPNWWISQGRRGELIDRLAGAIAQFAVAVAPRPVFYRSLDLRTHEFGQLPGSDPLPPAINPMLGLRGTYSYMANSTLFDLELTALAQVQNSGCHNVNLLLPFVRTVEEFRFSRERVEAAGLTHNRQFQLWIMAEVPSVLFLIPDYVKAGVQGISIGTNDLTQLLLGVDRDDGSIAAAFDEHHPAVQAAIAHLIQQATQAGIPCSICGQAPVHYPELIPDLMRWGISAISVELDAIPATYEAIVRAEQQFLQGPSSRPPTTTSEA